MTSPVGAQILALEDQLQQMRDQGAMPGGSASYVQGTQAPNPSPALATPTASQAQPQIAADGAPITTTVTPAGTIPRTAPAATPPVPARIR
jgi:hypothetical protein